MGISYYHERIWSWLQNLKQGTMLDSELVEDIYLMHPGHNDSSCPINTHQLDTDDWVNGWTYYATPDDNYEYNINFGTPEPGPYPKRKVIDVDP